MKAPRKLIALAAAASLLGAQGAAWAQSFGPSAEAAPPPVLGLAPAEPWLLPVLGEGILPPIAPTLPASPALSVASEQRSEATLPRRMARSVVFQRIVETTLPRRMARSVAPKRHSEATLPRRMARSVASQRISAAARGPRERLERACSIIQRGLVAPLAARSPEGAFGFAGKLQDALEGRAPLDEDSLVEPSPEPEGHSMPHSGRGGPSSIAASVRPGAPPADVPVVKGGDRQETRLSFIGPILCAAFLFPASTLLHELGHYAVARAFRRPAKLRYDHVLISGDEFLSHGQRIAISFAGPFMNLVQGAALTAAGVCFTDPLWSLGSFGLAFYNYLAFAVNLLPADRETLFIKFPPGAGKEAKSDGWKIRESWRAWKRDRAAAPESTAQALLKVDQRGKVDQESYEDLDFRLKRIKAVPKDLREIERQVRKIIALEGRFKSLEQEDLKGKTQEFKRRLKRGESLDDILPEAFALVRETMARVLGKKPYVEQLAAAVGLHLGRATEQKTGEGKTLSIGLAAYLNALAGPVDIYTFNEYLALRDADELGRVFVLLGLKTAALREGHKAYLFADRLGAKKDEFNGNLIRVLPADAFRQADVLYGFNGAFIFDYLYDQGEEHAGPGLRVTTDRRRRFAIVDEADAELLEEADNDYRIVDSPEEGSGADHAYIYHLLKDWKAGEDFIIDSRTQEVRLTRHGRERLRQLQRANDYLKGLKHLEIFALNVFKALYTMKLNRDYVAMNGQIVLLDAHTGRLHWNRQWEDGLHRYLELKEGVALDEEDVLSSHIALNNYMKLYPKIAGITGTIGEAAGEFMQAYGLQVVRVPSHRADQRRDLPDLLSRTHEGKIKAVVADALRAHGEGRPVLVGAKDIAESALLGRALEAEGVPFRLLNGVQEGSEKEIVEQAGRSGAVTVATQLAGRGTDILLDEPALKAGGLHVVLTQKSDSRRVDDQFRGRAGRQGQPGSSRLVLSLEDELIARFATKRERRRLATYVQSEQTREVGESDLSALLKELQRRAERKGRAERRGMRLKDDLLDPLRSAYFAFRERRLFWSFDPFKRRYLVKLLQKNWDRFIGDYEDLWRGKGARVTAEELAQRFQNLVLGPCKAGMKFPVGFKGWLGEAKKAAREFFEGSYCAKISGKFKAKLFGFSLYRGRIMRAHERKRYKDVLRLADEALELLLETSRLRSDDHNWAVFQRGLAHLYLGEEEASLRDFVSSMELDGSVVTDASPLNLEITKTAIHNIALIFNHRGHRKEIAGDFQSAALDYRLAQELKPGGDYDRDLERAKQKLSESSIPLIWTDFPFLKHVYLYKAREAVDQENYGDAIYYYGRVLAISPTLATAYLGRAWSHHKAGHLKECLRDGEEGIKYWMLRSSQFAAMRGVYRLLSGETLDLAALEVFKTVGRLFKVQEGGDGKKWGPGDSSALEKQAEDCLARGDYAAALRCYAESLKRSIFDGDGAIRRVIAGHRERYEWHPNPAEISRFFDELVRELLAAAGKKPDIT